MAGIQLALAYIDARAGVSAAEEARRRIATDGLGRGGVEEGFDDARRAFARARRRASGILLTPVRVVPVVGAELRSFGAIAATAEKLAELGASTANSADLVIGAGIGSGEQRVTALRELSALANRATGVLDSLESRPRGGLLASSWRDLDEKVNTARSSLGRAAAVLGGIATILEGPRHYLFLVANNGEMRAGSGMFLGAGALDTRGGAITTSDIRATGDITLPDGGVPVTGDIARNWGWLTPGREWRNLGVTPRFDVSAEVASRMWEALTGEKVAGVIAVDIPFLRALLGIIGPVDTGDGVVTEETVVDQLLYEQYVGQEYSEPAHAARRERLGRIAQAVLQAAQERPFRLDGIGGRLKTLTEGRHLLAWSPNPDDQRTWDVAGVSGTLEPNSLAVSLLNRGGNKLDRFIDIRHDLDIAVSSNTTDVTVRVTVHNTTPTGQPLYVAGPHPDSGLREGDYLGILTVSVPGAAEGVSIENSPVILAGPDGPTRVVATQMVVGRDEKRTVVVRFRLPADSGSFVITPSARLSPTTWSLDGSVWRDDSPGAVSWRRGDLGRSKQRR